MTRKASRPGQDEKKVGVRFLGCVKSGGRWFQAGETATLAGNLLPELEKAGLIERLESETSNARSRAKGGSRALSHG